MYVCKVRAEERGLNINSSRWNTLCGAHPNPFVPYKIYISRAKQMSLNLLYCITKHIYIYTRYTHASHSRRYIPVMPRGLKWQRVECPPPPTPLRIRVIYTRTQREIPWNVRFCFWKNCVWDKKKQVAENNQWKMWIENVFVHFFFVCCCETRAGNLNSPQRLRQREIERDRCRCFSLCS